MTSTALVPYYRKRDPASLETVRNIRRGIVVEVCERITEGDFIAAACRRHNIDARTLRDWIEADREYLAPMYARARSASADALAEEARAISNGTDDLGVMALELAELEAETLPPKYRRAFLSAFDSVRATRDRLRVDTLKWLAAKRRPRVYGDKVDITTDGQALPAAQTVVFGGREIKF